MYQPISFNVIRQALEWHGLPVPTLRQLSYRDQEPGEWTAEYLAMWSMDRLVEYMSSSPVPPYDVLTGEFVNRLRECFCADIDVVDAHINPLRNDLVVLLYVRVSKGISRWFEDITQ